MKKTFTTSVLVQDKNNSILCGSSLTTISNSLVLSDGSIASGCGGFQIKTENIQNLIDLLTEAKKSLETAEKLLSSA